MTRNIYLGGNIFRLAEAGSLQQIPPIVGELFGNVVATDFAARADALADEIAATNPALIGLQEVELYRVQEPSDFSAIHFRTRRPSASTFCRSCWTRSTSGAWSTASRPGCRTRTPSSRACWIRPIPAA